MVKFIILQYQYHCHCNLMNSPIKCFAFCSPSLLTHHSFCKRLATLTASCHSGLFKRPDIPGPNATVKS